MARSLRGIRNAIRRRRKGSRRLGAFSWGARPPFPAAPRLGRSPARPPWVRWGTWAAAAGGHRLRELARFPRRRKLQTGALHSPPLKRAARRAAAGTAVGASTVGPSRPLKAASSPKGQRPDPRQGWPARRRLPLRPPRVRRRTQRRWRSWAIVTTMMVCPSVPQALPALPRNWPMGPGGLPRRRRCSHRVPCRNRCPNRPWSARRSRLVRQAHQQWPSRCAQGRLRRSPLHCSRQPFAAFARSGYPSATWLSTSFTARPHIRATSV